jgi:hypothetical protein
MDVVRLDVHFQYLNILLLGKCPYTVPNFMANMPGQDAMAVFGNLHDMVLAVPNGV